MCLHRCLLYLKCSMFVFKLTCFCFVSDLAIIYLALSFALLGTCPAYQRLESVNRFHYGASFRHHGQLYNDVDVWTHTFEIQLPHLTFPILPIRPCANSTNFFCIFRGLLLCHLNTIQANASNDVQSTFQLIEHMLGRVKTPAPSNSRSR